MALSTPTSWADTGIRAAKTAVAAFIGIVGANALNYTNVPTLKAAAIAGLSAGVTVCLNAVLTWTSSP